MSEFQLGSGCFFFIIALSVLYNTVVCERKVAVNAFSCDHTKYDRGRFPQVWLGFSFRLWCDNTNHKSLCLLCLLPDPLPLLDSQWLESIQDLKNVKGKSLIQTCCIFHFLCDTPEEHCIHHSVSSDRTQASRVFMKLQLRNLSYVANERVHKNGSIVWQLWLRDWIMLILYILARAGFSHMWLLLPYDFF